MGRVLAISSQTVYGPVGNSAAVPALQARGHEVMALPTVLLSHHPGHGSPAGQATPEPLLRGMLSKLRDLGAVDSLDGVLTGYFANAEQVIAVAEQIVSLAKQHQGLHVLVDPVIGDHGALYVSEDVANAIRDHLLPLATITTPNLFELQWLSAKTDVGAAVTKLNIAETIVTSIPVGSELLTQLYAAGQVTTHIIVRREKVPHGTGDYLAGCYLAERMRMPAEPAFKQAMKRLESAVARSAGSAVLDLCAHVTGNEV
jgi:pyridoxine kinase